MENIEVFGVSERVLNTYLKATLEENDKVRKKRKLKDLREVIDSYLNPLLIKREINE